MSLSLPSTLTDSELRGAVLRWFYERRRDGTLEIGDLDFSSAETANEFYRIAKQLCDHGLVDLKSIGILGRSIPSMPLPKYSGSIRANGVDVVEGNSRSPISITIDNRNMNVSVSKSQGVQVGSANSQLTVQMSVEQLKNKLVQSPSSKERDEAKGMWNRFFEHPLVCALLGGAVSNFKID